MAKQSASPRTRRSRSASARSPQVVGSNWEKHEPGILDFWFEGRYQPYEAADVSGVPMDGNMR